MVGGSTRTIYVREQVGEFFGREPWSTSIRTASSRSVPRSRPTSSGNKPDDEMLLLDVNPLSLGIETMGRIDREDHPTQHHDPGRAGTGVHDLQGWPDRDGDPRGAGRARTGQRLPLAGALRVARYPADGRRCRAIRVTFAVDADGLLQVEAREQTSGCRRVSRSNRRTALTDDEITGMLRASIDHARDDMDARRLVEERVEAQRVIEALNAALAAMATSCCRG